MEYKLLKILRYDMRMPFLLRLFFGIFFIVVSIIPIVLPIFPGSLIVWIFLLIMWMILVISPKKIRHIIKMRKSIVYLFSNIHNKHIVRHKIYDIKSHVFDILKEDKKNLNNTWLEK